MAAVGLGGPPDPRPLPFFDLRSRLGQLVKVAAQVLDRDGVPNLLAYLHHPVLAEHLPPATILFAEAELITANRPLAGRRFGARQIDALWAQ